MASILNVDQINNAAGTSALTIDSSGNVNIPGHVLQVESATKTDVFTTTSTSNTPITGLSVTLTPASTSSKVLVTFNINAGCSNNASAVRIFKNGSVITGAIGDNITTNEWTVNVYNGGDDSNSTPNWSMSFLDSPSTTSATTYALYVAQVQGGGTFVLNDQTSQVRGTPFSGTSASTITAMEIAQ